MLLFYIEPGGGGRGGSTLDGKAEWGFYSVIGILIPDMGCMAEYEGNGGEGGVAEVVGN